MLEQSTSGYMIKGEEGYLHILLYSDEIVRFAYSFKDTVPASTLAVVAEPVKVDVAVDGNSIKTARMIINIEPGSLVVNITDLEGNMLSADLKASISARKIEKKRLWEAGIYGSGEKYSWLNQLGYKAVHYNSDVLFHEPIHHALIDQMHTAIPFYLGVAPDRAYGIYFDNSYLTRFDFAKSDPDVISFQADGGQLDYYFIYGQTAAHVVGNYGLLTGTPPLPGKKVLGYHQSRYSYRNDEEILAVAEGLRENKIPCDVLYLDIHYMDQFKVFTVNRERFKDFKGILDKLKKMGFAVVVIVNPGVKVENDYRVFEEGKAMGYFVTTPTGELYQGEVWPKPAVFPDYLRSEVREWWGNFYCELLECGVEGIWNDMNEPTDFTQESGTLPDDTVHRNDHGTELTHAEVHNIYGMLQTMATREALEKYQPDRRAFVLTRAAFAGSQRYAALWTGDNASVWEHLENSIPMLLNLGMSGFSFVGADVGGYRGDCSGELLIRWTQLGAFYPYFRNHTEIDTARQEPWEYTEQVLEIVRSYICLRYRFLTYYYNLMRESTLHGQPAIRPLFYHHQDDLNTYNINDQFLLGEGVMVCPVVRPGVDKRLVYLPSGTWYDYWTNEKIEGHRYIAADAPLDKLPLYVKAGTILPQDELSGYGLEGTEEKIITVNCYSGSGGLLKLYLDDGISNGYLRGEYSEVEIVMSDLQEGTRTRINILHDGYPIPEINLKIY